MSAEEFDSSICPICAEIYSNPSRRPLLLANCGHSLCERCFTQVKLQATNGYSSAQCPMCRKVILNLQPPTNFQLLSLVEEAEKMRLNFSKVNKSSNKKPVKETAASSSRTPKQKLLKDTVYFCNFPTSLGTAELISLFDSVADVKVDAQGPVIHLFRANGVSRGMGTVAFVSNGKAKHAIKNLHNKVYPGTNCKMTVRYAHEHPPREKRVSQPVQPSSTQAYPVQAPAPVQRSVQPAPPPFRPVPSAPPIRTTQSTTYVYPTNQSTTLSSSSNPYPNRPTPTPVYRAPTVSPTNQYPRTVSHEYYYRRPQETNQDLGGALDTIIMVTCGLAFWFACDWLIDVFMGVPQPEPPPKPVTPPSSSDLWEGITALLMQTMVMAVGIALLWFVRSWFMSMRTVKMVAFGVVVWFASSWLIDNMSSDAPSLSFMQTVVMVVGGSVLWFVRSWFMSIRTMVIVAVGMTLWFSRFWLVDNVPDVPPPLTNSQTMGILIIGVILWFARSWFISMRTMVVIAVGVSLWFARFWIIDNVPDIPPPPTTSQTMGILIIGVVLWFARSWFMSIRTMVVVALGVSLWFARSWLTDNLTFVPTAPPWEKIIGSLF